MKLEKLFLLGLVFVYNGLYQISWGVQFLSKIFLSPTSPLYWIVLFIILDFLFYWAHRYSHELKVLWASHVVHHSSEEFNLSVAYPCEKSVERCESERSISLASFSSAGKSIF